MKNIFASVLVALAFSGFAAFAQPADEVSKENREKMAAHHEKMAQCLRSQKTMKQCHEEMHAQCENDGMEGCPMMGKGMGMGMGKMKRHQKNLEEKKDK